MSLVSHRVHLPLVFLNKVEVVPANNNGSVHLGAVACSSNNSASDRNGSSEWAFLVNVGPCAQTNIKDLLTHARNVTNRCIVLGAILLLGSIVLQTANEIWRDYQFNYLGQKLYQAGTKYHQNKKYW